MIFYNADRQDVLQNFNPTRPLIIRIIRCRKNAVNMEKTGCARRKKEHLAPLLDQFKDIMILIAAVISFAIACVNGEPKDFFEPALILLIVILNAIMGVQQESKAEKALDALKNLSAPHARVLRNGTEKVIDAAERVPGIPPHPLTPPWAGCSRSWRRPRAGRES